MTSLFELPIGSEASEIHVLPIPWEQAVSFRRGTAQFPSRFQVLSHQIDAYDRRFPSHADRGFFLDESLVNCTELSETPPTSEVTAASIQLADSLYQTSLSKLKSDKRVIVLGGDHSVSLGAVRAHAETYDGLGILQIDAHMDLRDGYDGQAYSHASVMHHVSQLSGVQSIVQVGVRDYCQEEYEAMVSSGGRIKTYFDDQLNDRACLGESWHDIACEIINQLPDAIYLTVDIDGLSPHHGMHTGTPVPGGLSYHQLMYLLKVLSDQGKSLVGFDLVEVSGVEEDVIFATHLVYNISQYLA